MLNYAEEMSYWYLRLNGFFLIDDYVLHKNGLNNKQNSDCDIIGIKMANSKETIDGHNYIEYDELLFEDLNENENVAIICEVKSGRYKKKELFKVEKIKYCLKRFGLLDEKNNKDITEKVMNNKVYKVRDFYVLKLLISQKSNDSDIYKNMTLNHINKFIKQRIESYRHGKNQSRMFFLSNLMQYIILV